MRTKIRWGSFETNSSSHHSIVVKRKDEMITREMIEDPEGEENISVKGGQLILYDFEMSFERSPFQVLTDLRSKLCFAIAEYCSNQKKPDMKLRMITQIIKGVAPDLEKIVLPWSRSSEDGVNYGYVDHQSAGVLQNFIKDHGICLKEFLLNKKYVVVCDGDEYYVWEDLKDSGFINFDVIAEEYDRSDETVYYEKRSIKALRNASETEED